MSEKCPFCNDDLPEDDDLAIAHFEGKHTYDEDAPSQEEVDNSEAELLTYHYWRKRQISYREDSQKVVTTTDPIQAIRTSPCSKCHRYDSIMLLQSEIDKLANEFGVVSYVIEHPDHKRQVLFSQNGKYIADCVVKNEFCSDCNGIDICNQCYPHLCASESDNLIVRCFDCRNILPYHEGFGYVCLNCPDPFSRTWEECISGDCSNCDACWTLREESD